MQCGQDHEWSLNVGGTSTYLGKNRLIPERCLSTQRRSRYLAPLFGRQQHLPILYRTQSCRIFFEGIESEPALTRIMAYEATVLDHGAAQIPSGHPRRYRQATRLLRPH